MDTEIVWEQLIQQLKSYPTINSSQIDAFFQRLKIQAVSSDFIMFTAKTGFIKEWIETHYSNDIKQALRDIYGRDYVIQIEVDPTQEDSNTTFATPVTSPAVSSASMTDYQTQTSASSQSDATQPNVDTSVQSFQRDYPTAESPDPKRPFTYASEAQQTTSGHSSDALSEYQKQLSQEVNKPFTPSPMKDSSLNTVTTSQIGSETVVSETTVSNTNQRPELQSNIPEINRIVPAYTFNNFVIGDSNRMAYMMAEEVAIRPGAENHNPLFIYGRSGVGKTHLLFAIQNHIIENYPQFNVCYIDSNELVNKYSDAAIEKSVDKYSFKNFEGFFKDIDVLLIDDIQGLQGKPGTLEVVFRIFKDMTIQGKQMVFAADRAPKNIDLEERYSSRFNQGATIDIQPPDDETKRNIIKKFMRECAEEEQFPGNIDEAITEEIIEYIIEHSSSNIREVHSAVIKLVFALKVSDNQTLSNADMKHLLDNHFIDENTSRVTADIIQKSVEEFFKISHADLVGPKRKKAINHARQIAIYLIRELLDETYESIGAMFNRDHSTVVYAYDQISYKLKGERDLHEEIEAIRTIIKYRE